MRDSRLLTSDSCLFFNSFSNHFAAEYNHWHSSSRCGACADIIQPLKLICIIRRTQRAHLKEGMCRAECRTIVKPKLLLPFSRCIHLLETNTLRCKMNATFIDSFEHSVFNFW